MRIKCSEFQQKIPDIINGTIEDSELERLLEHLNGCKDCYDELEIYYVLQKGLDEIEEKGESLNYIESLKKQIGKYEKRVFRMKDFFAMRMLVGIMANTALIGAFIYIFFIYLI